MLKKTASKLIGSILVELGLLDQKLLDRALEVHNERKGQSLIGEILVELGFVKEEDIIRAFKIQYSIPYINIGGYNITRDVIDSVPVTLARKYKLIPLDKVENCLTIAMANPLNDQAINEVKAASACNNVQVYIAAALEIKEAIDRYYPKSQIEKSVFSLEPAGEDAPGIPAQPVTGTPSAESTTKKPLPKNKSDIRSDERYFNIKNYNISREVIDSVPVALARKYKLIPLNKLEDCIAIAMADPSNNKAIKAVKDASFCNEVLIYVAAVSEIKEAIDKYYLKPD